MKGEKAYHIPVMLQEILDLVNKSHCNFFVDCTVGRGGHFFKVLERVDKVVGIDYNQKSIEYIKSYLNTLGYIKNGTYFEMGKSRAYISCANFADISTVIEDSGFGNPDIVFADLGISTDQIKTEEVGISFLKPDEPLDMRVDSSKKVMAASLLNALSQKELEMLFRNLGECKDYKSISKNVVEHRKHKKFETVGDFIQACGFKKRPGKMHTATKPFMALRIAVNAEHINLGLFLDNITRYLNKGSLCLVITFHSLEQLKINNFAKENNVKLEILMPSQDEVVRNKSSRSAKLNILKK